MEITHALLFIGGTNMTGPFAVRALLDAGHDVLLLHRSHSDSPLLRGSAQIIGDKSELPAMRERLTALQLDVIVHMVAFTQADAAALIQAAAGIVPRSGNQQHRRIPRATAVCIAPSRARPTQPH